MNKFETTESLVQWKEMPLNEFLQEYSKKAIDVSADNLSEVIGMSTLNQPELFKNNILAITQIVLRAVPKMSDHMLSSLSRSIDADAVEQLFLADEDSSPEKWESRKNFFSLQTGLRIVYTDRMSRRR